MDPRLASILELQEAMATQKEIEDDYEEIPKRRNEIQSTLGSIQQEIEEVQERLKKHEVEQKSTDMELQQGQESRVKKEAQLFSIKSPKELQAVQSEIENLDRKNSRLEEKSLELIDKIEAEKKALKEKKEELDKKEKEFEKEQKELDEREQGLSTQLEEAQNNTQEIANRLAPNLYQKFMRVFKGRNGVAVASANEGYCGACNVQLTPRLIQMAKRGQDIVQCEGCSRFLYWDTSLEEDDLESL